MQQPSSSDNLNYISFLAKKYSSHGWNIYSNILKTCENIPEGWTGPEPDLFLVKGKHATAVCVESLLSIKSENAVDKWKEIKKEKKLFLKQSESFVAVNVKLFVAVRDKKTMAFAKRIAAATYIKIDCHLIRKPSRSKRKKIGSKSFLKNSKIDKLILLAGVIVLLGFLYLVVPKISGYLKVKDFYQPFDTERQRILEENIQK